MSKEKKSKKEAVYCNLTNDYFFKKVFGEEGDENITRGLLRAITKRDFKKISLEGTPIVLADVKSGKTGVLDVIIKAEDEDINIEMQVAQKKFMVERVLWYWSRKYGITLKSGKGYSTARKTRCILIIDFNLDVLEELLEFHTEWKIIENKYRKIVLTDKFQLDIIELNKVENNTYDEEDEELVEWCKFIKSSEVVEKSVMEKYEEIKEAKKKLDQLNEDEKEQNMALLREKSLHDEATLREESYENGYAEGEVKGRTEGEKSRSIEIAKELILRGMAIEEISAITKLSVEEIEKIKK